MIFDMGAGSTKATILKFQSRTVKDVGKHNKTIQEAQVMGSGWDRTLGGDSLNYLIVDDMVSQFVESKAAKKASVSAQGVKAHGRAMAKLLKEAERLRQVLSANQNTQTSFEGLFEDINFKYKITRTEFETLAEAHVVRLGLAVADSLKASGLDIQDLTSIILHGGATRSPFVQKALEKLVGDQDKIRANVNSDEAAVFGAGFRAAELSPSFRVKEIKVIEGGMYPSGLKYTTASGKQQRQRLWTATSPFGGVPKEMTFNEHADFSGSYFQQIDSEDKDIKNFSTKNLTSTVALMKEKYPSCSDADIFFKLAMKLSSDTGELIVTKSMVECEAEFTEKEGILGGVKNLFGFGKKDQQPLKGADKADAGVDKEGSEEVMKDDPTVTASSVTSSTGAGKDGAQKTAAAATGDAEAIPAIQKRLVSIPVDVHVESAGRPQLSQTELTKAKDRLKAFANSDKARAQREEALNVLEAYTYKVRDLLESEQFVAMSTEVERTKLAQLASEASEWLYGDGAEALKEEFKAKYKGLQDIAKPIQTRIEETAKRPELVTSLKEALEQTTQFLATIRKQILDFDDWQASASAASAAQPSTTEEVKTDTDSLEDDEGSSEGTKEEIEKDRGPVPPLYKNEDIDVVDSLHKSIVKWLEEKETAQAALTDQMDPVLLIKDINAKREQLDKAGMDLAMKGVKTFDKTKKKGGGKGTDGKKNKKNKKETKTASAEPAFHTIDIPSGKDSFSEEELEQIIKQAKAQAEDRGAGHDEL